ncbi:hypothetical protein DFP73DRAFT_592827 [Morchella snyderi]|nr:hypothetical protein DFP73DRAFT_592827 [Morchella snyderi]
MAIKTPEALMFPALTRTNNPDLQRYPLHTLHTRDETSANIDVVSAITGIIGVLIAIIGLVEGYRRWKQCRRDLMSSAVEETNVGMDVRQPPCVPPPNLSAADAGHVFYLVCAILTFLRMVHSILRPDDEIERDAGITHVPTPRSDTAGNIGLQNAA